MGKKSSSHARAFREEKETDAPADGWKHCDIVRQRTKDRIRAWEYNGGSAYGRVLNPASPRRHSRRQSAYRQCQGCHRRAADPGSVRREPGFEWQTGKADKTAADRLRYVRHFEAGQARALRGLQTDGFGHRQKPEGNAPITEKQPSAALNPER